MRTVRFLGYMLSASPVVAVYAAIVRLDGWFALVFVFGFMAVTCAGAWLVARGQQEDR